MSDEALFDCSKNATTSERRNDFVRNLLVNKYRIPSKRIISKDGYIRTNTDLEFWIIPKGAVLPKETPNSYSKPIVDCFCPAMDVRGEATITNKTFPLTFVANISDGAADEIKYIWKVSIGKIISGQGTPTIQVDLSRTKVKEVTATVEFRFEGCCEHCSGTESFTTKIFQ